MSGGPVPIGVVGVGHLGRHHARIYAGMPGVKLVAVVDSDYARAVAIAEEYGCEALSHASALAGRVAAASIATPTVHHREAAEILLRSGADVLIEKKKPSPTSSDAAVMRKLARPSCERTSASAITAATSVAAE